MPEGKKPLLSSMDVGNWAEHYASRPYGHHKAEVYELFIDILGCLPDESIVLDIGAGPGHLEYELCCRRPKNRFCFVLLDASTEMLRIARQRLAGRPVETFHRSFNADGWDEGLGQFDAIVSNNALFHVRPARLAGFYRSCYGLLRRNGLLLNQQSFGWRAGASPYGEDAFSRFMRALPERILPALPGVDEQVRVRLDREKKEASRSQAAAIAEARSAGVEFARGHTGYQWLTVPAHLDAMRAAGFAAGCIWRKREFAALCGVKGEPLATAGPD
jgi:SAM-dependent methyltransferase